MATDRSTDDYKKYLSAAVYGLLQNPVPLNKVDMLAADAVNIADKITAALDNAAKADQDDGTPGDKPSTPSTPLVPVHALDTFDAVHPAPVDSAPAHRQVISAPPAARLPFAQFVMQLRTAGRATVGGAHTPNSCLPKERIE